MTNEDILRDLQLIEKYREQANIAHARFNLGDLLQCLHAQGVALQALKREIRNS